MTPVRALKKVLESEKAGSLLLIACTLVSLWLANSPWQQGYTALWNTQAGGHHVTHWINDGLMAIFFLMIGLELEREIHTGSLSDMRIALFPCFAALGGMLVPACIYIWVNISSGTTRGAGIPMATDIAFAIGVLSLLGSRVPLLLKVFLTALAVIDDLGAIVTIAVFYTSSLSWAWLCAAMAVFLLLLLLNRFRVRGLAPYLFGGVLMWYCMLHSGVHATITGVLLAFVIPFEGGSKNASSYVLQKALHRPVAFIILPLFALANTCITMTPGWEHGLKEPNSLGILAGLVIGKPLGVMLFALLAVWMKLCRLPVGLRWKHIAAAGCLGGIGFTMSVFISHLAFGDGPVLAASKMAVLFASLASGVIGSLWLWLATGARKKHATG